MEESVCHLPNQTVVQSHERARRSSGDNRAKAALLAETAVASEEESSADGEKTETSGGTEQHDSEYKHAQQ